VNRLEELLNQVLARFIPNHPQVRANPLVWGFIVEDYEPLSIRISPQQATLSHDIKHAEYWIYGTLDLLESLFNVDTPNRVDVLKQLSIRPFYTPNNFVLMMFLVAFGLEIQDENFKPEMLMDYFPFPPRYPVSLNRFRMRHPKTVNIPHYDRQAIPQLIADEHPEWVATYNKAWQLAFKNLRAPIPESGFIAGFIDTAFNSNTFMWDSCFMMMFGHYGRRVFHFMGTLENFYAKQHDDGFISREINTYTGKDMFQSLDPRSTGPNLLAWTEWIAFELNGDKQRLKEVFPCLIAYHRWWKEWRTHPDGSYWTSGWGSGMDNQVRVPHSDYHHRHYTWVDATLQQALNISVLIQMAQVLGDSEFTDELKAELEHLTHYINAYLWDEQQGFYFDRSPQGELSQAKSIGTYWGLLSTVIPAERAARMIDHLKNPNLFNRPHRVPSQSYDSPEYSLYGGYWLGGVWSPTNYMVLRGLSYRGEHELAHEIALNHVQNVADVFMSTGTLWENYAPEVKEPGRPAAKDFVGWTGTSAISIPIEYVIGIRPQGAQTLVWDIRLKERHGVLGYPFGTHNALDLIYQNSEVPSVSIHTQEAITIILKWSGQEKTVMLEAGTHQVALGF
jgi:hypothetical protein